MVVRKKNRSIREKRAPATKVSAKVDDLRALFPHLRKRNYAAREEERRKPLLDDLKSAYQQRGLVVYVGAGVSRSVGLPTWPELIRTLTVRMMSKRVESAAVLKGWNDEQRWHFLETVSKDLEAQEVQDKPILMLARSIKNEMATELSRAIANVLYRRIAYKYRLRLKPRRGRPIRTEPVPPTSPLLEALVALARAERDVRGVQAIINYNYDDLLEENLRHQNVRCMTVLSGSQRVPDRTLPSYHVHGLVGLRDYVQFLNSGRAKPMTSRGNFVFSEDEYHAEYADPYKWSNMTQINHLGRYIGLFVGLSMQDPNLRRLIDVTHKQYPENYNFAILPRPSPLSANGDSKQAVLKNMFEEVESQSFAKIGVRVLWVDSHEEIAPLIRSIVGDENA